MKIEDARWCSNCDEVVATDVCPVCNSTLTYLIINWLKAKPNKKAA
jgi:RNA polymerase subunit RPABC4/transcription elongation factor Spt4